jgi:glycine cleavage system regulatory protein
MRKYIALFTLIVVVASCKKAENARFRTEALVATDSAASVAAPVAKSLQATADGLNAPAKPPPEPRVDRMIIRTATVSMVVGDTTAVIDQITAAVEANGGYINDSKVWREGELTRATLSLRVPAPRLRATLAAVRKLAIRVQNESISSEEVTQEYVDLTSRLRNLEATEVELRELMTEIRQRAKKAQDVLEISEQLSNVRGEIEKTKGRMQYLSQMSAFSTINLELIPDAAAKPVVEPGWQPVVVAKDAGRSLLTALKSLVDLLIWIVIYVLPLLALVALAAFVVVRIIRALLRRSKAVKSDS